MTAAIKNSIARLSVGKSITLGDHAGAEVKKTGKGVYSVNGHQAGDLEHTLAAIAAHEQDVIDQQGRAAEAENDNQVAAAEQRLDDEAAAGGRDNNEPVEAEGYQPPAPPVEGDQPQAAAEPTPDAEPGDNAAQIAADAPAAEWPTAALSEEPLTEKAVSTDGKYKTLTPAAIMVAAAGLASRPLPALIRLGAGGDPKARYYPGLIVSFDPAADGLVTVTLTGKDQAENRPFQLLRVQKPDGTTDVQAQHKVTRRTICIGTAAFDGLMAQKPKRSAAPAAPRKATDIATLEKQYAAALVAVQKAQAICDDLQRSIELMQAAAAAPANAPSENLRAEAEAQGVTFSAPDELNDPAPVIEDAGEFGGDDDDTTPTPQTETPPQPEEFAGNDDPAPTEYEIIEGGYQPDQNAGSIADSTLNEIQRERIEDDLIEDEQYHSIDRELAEAA